MRRTLAAVSAVLLCAALPGCGSAAPTASSTVAGPITVFAAASLTEAFTTLGTQFEHQHPGTSVTFSFAGSSTLAAQIGSGAPADVFASASTVTMDQVVADGAATDPTTFASNAMQIAVPPGNPGEVDSVSDLADTSVMTAVCQPQVPCGAAAQEVFAAAGVTVTPVTLEPDVKAVLSKVRLGEVDAGLVYISDVQSAGGDVLGVVIPAEVNASTAYPIAQLAASPNPVTAGAFIDYVLSSAGESVLTAAGFAQP